MKRVRNAAHKAAKKDWEKRNAVYLRDKQRDKRNALRKWIREDLIGNKTCSRCPENHIGCLEFHHQDPSKKEQTITLMAAGKYSRTKILEEISKCELLCSNCHRKHHWEEKFNGV